MKKMVILIIALMVLSIGFLSGCTENNEIINDDDKFLRKADAIVSDMYPITTSNVKYKGYKATSHRLEIADYTLSVECENIRESLDFALDQIDFLYQTMESPETYETLIDLINTYLELARTGIEYQRE